MITINLLPPDVHKKPTGFLLRALVILLILALLPLGAALAHYTYVVLPSLEKERDRLAESYRLAISPTSDRARILEATELIRGRTLWTRTLFDTKWATLGAVSQESDNLVWLSHFSGQEKDLLLEGYASSTKRSDAARLPRKVTTSIAPDSPIREAEASVGEWHSVAKMPGQPDGAFAFTLTGNLE